MTREEAIDTFISRLMLRLVGPVLADGAAGFFERALRDGRVDEALRYAGLTVAPPPGEDAKDAEIARLREAMAAAAREAEHAPVPSGEHWLMTSRARNRILALLEGSTVAARQPPPSPSREDATDRLANVLLHAFTHGARAFGHPVAVAENEGRAMRGGVSPETLEGITDRADTILRTLGLVAVDPALVERVRNPKHYDGEKLCPTCRERMPEAGEPFGHDTNECARKALLDAVLSQLSGGDR